MACHQFLIAPKLVGNYWKVWGVGMENQHLMAPQQKRNKERDDLLSLHLHEYFVMSMFVQGMKTVHRFTKSDFMGKYISFCLINQVASNL